MRKIYIKKWMIALLLLILGAICVGVCYSKYYSPATEECEKLERSVKALKVSIQSATDNLQQQPYYQEETEKLSQKTQELLDQLHFPGEILEEDQILYIQRVEGETKQPQMQITFGSNSTLMTSGSMNLQGKMFPFAYSTTYEGLKDLIAYFVENDKDPCSLVSLTISYDAQTDTCTGTMMLCRYFMTGIKPYTPPVIPGVEIGTDIIFG